MTSGHVTAVVQARASSTRFPGKVLADVEGAPLLSRLLSRLRHSIEVDEIAVATSLESGDDAVAEVATAAGVPVVRGPLHDVLERFRLAAAQLDAEVVVRLTGDCPLVDPAVVDQVVRLFRVEGVDYASNVYPPTYPDGLDVEVIARQALEQAAREAGLPSEREHVTLYLHRHPELFVSRNLVHDPDLSHLRWTVDHPEDLDFVRAVFRAFRGREDAFSTQDVLALLDRDPHLRAAMPGHARNEGLARSLEAERDVAHGS